MVCADTTRDPFTGRLVSLPSAGRPDFYMGDVLAANSLGVIPAGRWLKVDARTFVSR
jgi:hypothetical protein